MTPEEQAALTELEKNQLELEEMYDKNQLMIRVREEFRNDLGVDFLQLCHKAGLDEDIGIDILAQMAIRKRATASVLIGCLWRHYESSTLVAKALELAVDGQLMNYDPDRAEFAVIYQFTTELQQELDMFQYPMPMLVPPLTLHDNTSSGYLSAKKSSLILRDNHHNGDICLDHLNKMNQIPLTLNLDTANMVTNKWKGLDKTKQGESLADFRKRQRAFKKYDRVSRHVLELLMAQTRELYLTHKYDKRGRVYCQGYHVSYQGNDWNKAIIEFADQELVTD